MTDQTLYLLVTCSMDPSRARIAEQVVDSLVGQDRTAPFFRDLIVFDNASRHAEHLGRLPSGCVIVRADRNVGFWTAIDWTLRHHVELLGRTYRYLYVIESDLIHFAMERLSACERFLDEHADVGGVRTQEFSVRMRFLYDKRCPRLFRKTNAVAQTNLITGERVRFTLADRDERIYLTNFHAKVPALNRLSLVEAVFGELRQLPAVSEVDFMRGMYTRAPTIAQIDGGLFHALANIPQAGDVSGSYSSPEELARLGYRATRADRILADGYAVMRWNPAAGDAHG